ncbi:calcium uptake protein, mitochondrial isoform X1 [Amborella trichopoda]|uniref:calcium uptake protein, mitochondrial isoform X1 n=1 Tax=Amborella trichopoda TaxID=13333 RepID=UPI0005D2EE96|nr:calcium uptake protein, mitochondrial isoform X1 [Amborella trichopoda]|eukprot:XP_011626389.1 calcium uptake protein, mitochondrial isoform X1 [Amborella trichopoda]
MYFNSISQAEKQKTLSMSVMAVKRALPYSSFPLSYGFRLSRALVDYGNQQQLNSGSFSTLTVSPCNFGQSSKNPGFFSFIWSFSGLVVGASSLGFWFWPSPVECSTSSEWTSKEEESFSGFSGILGGRNTKFLFGEAYRRRVFFNYEKRLRLRSPPEKVFEYFASHRHHHGEMFMTPADLMRAVVPVFPPSDSHIIREGFLRGERPPAELDCDASQFFMLFDTNGDGLISFPEYIFFVTLLSIPEPNFSATFKMFDLDSNGKIEREEFKKVMQLMRSHNRQGSAHRDGLRPGFIVGDSVENGGLVEYFFGKDGKSSLQYEKFVKFLKDLHHEIIRLEFAHYDYKSCGTISARDFALSMVAAADMGLISKFLDRVDELSDNPHLRDMQITFEEFKAFAELRKKLYPLALAIFSYGKVNGLLTKDDFQRAASHVCDVVVTENMVDVVFHVFDANRDGNLSIDEFLGAVQRRERDIGNPMEMGCVGVVSCWLSCTCMSPFACASVK